MEFKDIKRLIELIKQNDLSEFSLEKDDFRLKVKRGEPGGAPVVHQTPVVVPAPAPAAIPHPAAPHPAPVGPASGSSAEESESGEYIRSPMVGTFYRAPAPDQDPFISVGQTVEADSVVCIVEAMKVLNEITADRSGKITKILVEDATPVEYNQPLFEIEPS